MKRAQDEIDDLYRGPLEDFTRARNALAKTRSGNERKQIATLVKPSLPMWAINQLYWKEPAAYNALIDASEKLRSAHFAALAGRKADTHKAEELHRTTQERALARVVALAEKEGARLSDAAVESIRRTLRLLPGDEPAGRLTREPPPAGFSLLTGVKPRPEPPPSARKSEPAKIDREALRRQKLAEKAAAKQRMEAERKARQEAERQRREQRKREREIAKAEEALREAERRLAELKG